MIKQSISPGRFNLWRGDVPTAGEQKTGQDEGNQPEGEFTWKKEEKKIGPTVVRTRAF